MGSYLLVFLAAAATSFVATPVVRLLSLRLGWIDRPSDRKVHPRPTPTAGGLAIFLGVAVGIGVSHLIPFLAGLHELSSDTDAALLAALVIVVVGFLDDTRGVSPLGKLAGQVLAAGLLVLYGVQLLYFYVPGLGTVVLDSSLGVPLTVLWVVATVNAVNLIDGLDGLAAGMVTIGAVAFFIYMYWGPGPNGEATTAALLSAVAAGAAVGFLPWNLHPARIFMGDSGAMLLGLVMGVATISGVGRNAYGPTGGDLAAIAIPVVVPLLVLAVPILDVVLAIVRRMRRGVGILHADKEHIHHRLLDIGHSHRQAVLLMYLWSALISGCSLAVAFLNGRLLVGGIIVAAGLIAAVLPRAIRDSSPRGNEGVRVALSGEAPAGRSASAGAPADATSGRVKDSA